jgi:hypothetical protein
MVPLTFSVAGDLFPPEKRGKWIGLLLKRVIRIRKDKKLIEH